MKNNERFVFESKIGEGGMGEVYKVYDNDLEKTCALKLSKFSEEDSIQDTINEATVWFQFRDYAYVVEVYEIIRLEQSKIGILMEFMDGGNLRTMLFRGASLDDKLFSLFDISSAIINCNSKVSDFSHLDIKPENCLRTRYGLTKLTDFGTSCYLKTDLKELYGNKTELKIDFSLPIQTNVGIRCVGTPLYMSPEQITGTMVDKQKSDVYSFSLLALELISGKHPLQNIETLDDIFASHIRGISHELRQWPANLSNKLKDIFNRALNPDPYHRPTMQDINDVLRLKDSGYGRDRVDHIKLSDPIEQATRKGKSLWALGQYEASLSIIKSNLKSDPFQADLWHLLAMKEWELFESTRMSELNIEQIMAECKTICSYAFRALVLDNEKFLDQNHEDYKFIHMILPQMAAQSYINNDDMDGFYKWRTEFISQQKKWLTKQEEDIHEGGGPVRCLCVKCGEIKMHISERCPRCGFRPDNITDLYHTYRLRAEAVRVDGDGELSYWIKMRYLRDLGKNIKKTVFDITSSPDYPSLLKEFEQTHGAYILQLINFSGKNNEIEYLKKYHQEKYLGKMKKQSKESGLKNKIKRFFGS